MLEGIGGEGRKTSQGHVGMERRTFPLLGVTNTGRPGVSMDSMDRVGFGGPGWHSCVTTNPGPLDSQTQSPPGQAARRALTDDTELSARAAVAEEGTCLHQEDRGGSGSM